MATRWATDRPSRRAVLARLGAVGALGLAGTVTGAGPARAQSPREAQALVERVVADVSRAIEAGRSEAALLADFERIFTNYADVPAIARSALGPAARNAPAPQMRAFTEAFQTYLARKYGRRFREMIGGRIEVTGARPVRSYMEVISVARLRGQAPFDLRWHVSDRGGRLLFFNIIIDGVNMLAAERTEIGAMLDRRRGNIDALTADLRAM